MKTILVTIPIYGTNNIEFFKKQLTHLLLVNRFFLDIHLFLNELDKIQFDEIVNQIKSNTHHNGTKGSVTCHYLENLGKMLPQQCRIFMNQSEKIYDYYLYTEDDLLIQEYNLMIYDHVDNLLNGSDYVSGFLRYEEGIEDNSYTDLNGMHSIHRGGDGFQIIKSRILYNDLEFFEPWNIHSSCFIFNKEQFQYFKESNFLLDLNLKYCDEIETIGSNLYLRKFTKVYPVDGILLDGLEIHHMPNKYVYQKETPTRKTLKNLLGRR